MTDAVAGEPEAQAEIVVTRRRPVWQGLLSFRWRVFIDGVWVGNLPRGKATTFRVSPGVHQLKVWSRTGAYWSNLVDLTVPAEHTSSYWCQVRPLATTFGESIARVRSLARAGGAEVITLAEDTGERPSVPRRALGYLTHSQLQQNKYLP